MVNMKFFLSWTVETLPQQGEKEQAVSDSQPASSNVVPTDVVDGVEGSGTASSDNRYSGVRMAYFLIRLLSRIIFAWTLYQLSCWLQSARLMWIKYVDVFIGKIFRVHVVDYTAFIGCLPSLSPNDRPKLLKRIVAFQARFVFLLIYSCKSDLTRDDSQRRFWAQHSVAILEQCCNVVLR